MNRYIALDTETGGVTLSTSLLTAFFVVLDEKFQPVEELYLRVKPNDGHYVTTARGLEVNQINLVEHDKVAITCKEARTPLYKFVERNFQGNKLTPIAHGAAFDLARVKQDLMSEGSWENFVSYRTLDTSIVCQYLRAAGVFPENVSGSLGSLVDYFGLQSKGELHDARVDTFQTIALLQELLKFVTPVAKW